MFSRVFWGFQVPRRPKKNDYRSTFLNDEDSGTFSGHFSNDNDQMGFNIFTNPLEMHIYFEKQMKDVLKNFGFSSEDSFFGFGNDGSSFIPTNEAPDYGEPSGGNLRDYYLKPGYKQSDNDPHNRIDDDVDGKINASDLDGVFDKEKKLVPLYKTPRIQMFGQSVVTRTVRNSDGTTETHRIVKDNNGNEETTVIRKKGDQEYTVITKIDKDGQKEVTENLVNLDENDVQKFLDSKSSIYPTPIVPDIQSPYNWFPFDKFF